MDFKESKVRENLIVTYPKIIYKKDKEQYVNNFYNQML